MRSLRSIAGLLISALAAAGQPEPTRPALQLAGQIELPRLVDVAAQRLEITIEYDPAVLKGTVTLRSEGDLSDEALWGLPDGHTVVVGGIELTTEGESVSQVPLLGDIPLVGEVFKSRSKSKSRQRFYVFIRANILRSTSFEDLKYLSEVDTEAAGIDDGWPEVEPRVIK